MKLSPISWLIIGFALAICAIAFGLIDQYFPNENDASTYRKNTELQDAEAAKMNKAKKRVEDAKAVVIAKDQAWSAYVATRTPPTSVAAGGINLDENGYQLVIDTMKFRNSIQRALNDQLRVGGVKVLNAPEIPTIDPNIEVNSILPSFYNIGELPFPAVMFDFGQITVQGTYAQIMKNVRSWKNMPHYLAVADGLSLSGTSPVLTGTYNLSIVGFIRGKHTFVPMPEQATATSFGGGAGGRRGGFGGAGGGMVPPGFGGAGIPGPARGAGMGPGAFPGAGRPPGAGKGEGG